MNHDFLPVCREDMEKRGWKSVDFAYIIGDGYVDHPSFGHAIISRLLESRGYRVGIISQPDWKDPESICIYGEPRLGFLVSAGNMDSMVNHYSVSKKRRRTDAYTPGGEMGKRPDHACVVYGNLIRQKYKKTAVIMGGIEASLRRMAHYDWGEEKSEPYRLFTAQILHASVDSLMNVRRHPNILIMGDFNDYPTNNSIAKVLGAVAPKGEVQATKLYNLMDGRKDGTYRYRGEWGILDQLIVSGFLLQGHAGIRTSYDKAQIVRFPFLLEEDEKYGGDIPFRTYWGRKYHGGFSDHLPVCVDFEIGKK